MHILDQLCRPVPSHVDVKKRFICQFGDGARAMILAVIDEEEWLLYWNTDYEAWTSLRKPTPADYLLLDKAATIAPQ